MKILIVDGLFTACRIITNLLQDSGFTNISEANDGETAFTMLQEGDFDFLLTEYKLEIISGVELLKMVREDEKLSKLPVLMVAGEMVREQIIEAAQAGVNGYLAKPFTKDSLKAKIDAIFA